MAFNLPEYTISFPAGTDLSAYQFGFVKFDSTGRLAPCTGKYFALGVLTNQPSATGTPTGNTGVDGPIPPAVAISGVTRLQVSHPVSAGDFLVPDAYGWGTTVADATSATKYVRAIALESATLANDIIAVRLIDPSPGADSTVVS